MWRARFFSCPPLPSACYAGYVLFSKKLCFEWCSDFPSINARCFINLRGGRDHFGVIKQALRFIVPPLIIHLQAITLFYKPNKKTWQFSPGIPSNTANILYENNLFCYSLKLPKFLSRLSLLKRTPLQRQLYKQCLFSA